MQLRLNHSSDPRESVDFAGEANHRIANHLAMIHSLCRTQAKSLRQRSKPLTGVEAGEVLDALGAKLEAISLLHRRLATAGAETMHPLGEYLGEVVGRVGDALTSDDVITFERAEKDCTVSARFAASIGLIVCELVTNAMKYAHPSGVGGRIEVRCRGEGDRLVIEVEDDGVGLPKEFDADAAGGLGHRWIKAMACQMGARLDFRDTGLGLVVALSVPVAVEA